ncbi:hypothetical protein EJB05_50984, partial [Eragrostis curvula]
MPLYEEEQSFGSWVRAISGRTPASAISDKSTCLLQYPENHKKEFTGNTPSTPPVGIAIAGGIYDLIEHPLITS